MDIREMDVGMAPCLVGRVSYTGDLGYEIWMEPEYQRHVLGVLLAAGAEHGLRLFGSRALNALRLEKLQYEKLKLLIHFLNRHGILSDFVLLIHRRL